MVQEERKKGMTLLLEVEYLNGVCFAAGSQGSVVPDWPPQIDRIFSALVASWGEHGEPGNEREALEWLERQAPPLYQASGGSARSAPEVYVPPNDYEVPKGGLEKLKWYQDFLSKGKFPPKNSGGRKAWKDVWCVMPDERKRSGLKDRLFPAFRPHDPVVRLVWQEEPDDAVFGALQALARDTAYVGHSASLTRCRFLRSESPSPEMLRESQRCVYPGRLQELSESYKRFLTLADKKHRPRPGALVRPQQTVSTQSSNVFSCKWLVLEHVGGRMPDIRGAALVAREIRTALMSGYGKVGEDVPVVISGHDSDGSPTRSPHLAIVPLSFTGFPYADGRVLGFGLIPPSGFPLFEDEVFLRVLRRLAPLDENMGRRVLEVKSPRGTASDRAFSLRLSPSFEASSTLRSLDPTLYVRESRNFASVTPIVLDRFLKKRGDARTSEIAEQIASACERVGLPTPTKVLPSINSVFTGAEPSLPGRDAPRWLNWRVPASLAGRQLIHAEIEFEAPVSGPVLIGAGRFVGMGLCRPLCGTQWG